MPGWLRAVFAAPHPLYDHGLGWLLGGRFVRVSHVGRRSGRPYRTVLEVVAHDRRSGAVTVVSGFGGRSDWFRNVTAGGPVGVDLGHGPRLADHEVLPTDEVVGVLEAYERRNRLAAPVLRRALSGLVGWRYTGTDAARRRLAEELPMVRFTPAADARREGRPATTRARRRGTRRRGRRRRGAGGERAATRGDAPDRARPIAPVTRPSTPRS